MAFRVIDDKFWTDPKVRHKLDKDARYLLLYFVSNPHGHFSGLYYLPMVLVVHETGLSEKDIRHITDTLSANGLVYVDGELIWVVNMLRYQMRGKKAGLGVARHLRSIHPSPLVARFVDYYSERGYEIPYQLDTETLNSTGYPIEYPTGVFDSKNPNGYPIGTPSQLCSSGAGIVLEEDKTLDTEKKGKSEGGMPKDFPDEVQAAWNALPEPVAKIRKIKDDRLLKLKARYADPDWRAEWRASIERIAGIPGITGRCDHAWVINFDAWLRPAIFRKIVEGSYDHWGNDTKTHSTGSIPRDLLRAGLDEQQISDTQQQAKDAF